MDKNIEILKNRKTFFSFRILITALPMNLEHLWFPVLKNKTSRSPYPYA